MDTSSPLANKALNEDSGAQPDGGEYLLAADIGGTNARFVAVPYPATDIGRSAIHLSLATGDFKDASALIDAVVERTGGGAKFAGSAFAIAGPVAGGRGTLTNGTLSFDQQRLSQRLKCPAVVVNDFYAVAASIGDDTPLQEVGKHLQAESL